jgi:hypothetical protein
MATSLDTPKSLLSAEAITPAEGLGGIKPGLKKGWKLDAVGDKPVR